jgi:hypothetical protein
MLFTQEDLDTAIKKESFAEAEHETARQEEIRIAGLAYEAERKARDLAARYTAKRREAFEAQANGSPDTVYLPMLKEAERIAATKKVQDSQYSFLTAFAQGDAELNVRRKDITLRIARRRVLQIRGERLRAQTEAAIGAATDQVVVINFPNDSQAVRWLSEAASLTGEITFLQGELASRTQVIDAMKSDAAPALFNI